MVFFPVPPSNTSGPALRPTTACATALNEPGLLLPGGANAVLVDEFSRSRLGGALKPFTRAVPTLDDLGGDELNHPGLSSLTRQ